ncbi:CYTH domain-containing protein [Aggregatibacter aphrophilus]|uniref:CYTH domain-containing protein n=1 Tax=Aggregatibacter aphrophilus TaxID=732 RepID=UPI001D0E1941|nr:CYTH domain-containing protein [Aggregatibacter aphrophilus]
MGILLAIIWVTCSTKGNDYTLTLKTDGKVSGGLHVRPEYNVTLPNAEPNLAALTEQYELLLETTAPLKAIFSTDFERQMWLIQASLTSQIEVAVDLGNVIVGEKQQSLAKLNLKLKKVDWRHFLPLWRVFYSVIKAKCIFIP